MSEVLNRTLNGFSIETPTLEMLLSYMDLQIPNFQRKFVWKKDKKRLLIDSIWNGYPIGTLTLYKKEKHGSTSPYLIIDGLQRINTLTEFLTSPFNIVSFNDYFSCVEELFIEWIERYPTDSKKINKIKKSIKKWYIELGDELFSANRLSRFVKQFENDGISIELEQLEKLHELIIVPLNLTQVRVSIIIYHGEIDSLPDLFKNINTGTVPLSQYEVFQSTWFEYVLDKNYFSEIIDYLNFEYNLIQEEYTIDSKVARDEFRIFDNFLALNTRLCCIEDLDVLFNSFTRCAVISLENSEIKKYYKKQDLSFEIISTLLMDTTNKINQAVETVFNGEKEKVNLFLSELNKIIINSVNNCIQRIVRINDKKITKYHSLYLLCGYIIIHYEIDVLSLTINERKINVDEYINVLFEIENQLKENWFVDENRQLSFFKDKLLSLKESLITETEVSSDSNLKYNYDYGRNEVVKKDIFHPDCEVLHNLQIFLSENIVEIDANLFKYKNTTFFADYMQDVNNEPENKRLQGNIIKEAKSLGMAVVGIYPNYDYSGNKLIGLTYVAWDYNVIKNNKSYNPSLKVKLGYILKHSKLTNNNLNDKELLYNCSVFDKAELLDYLDSNCDLT